MNSGIAGISSGEWLTVKRVLIYWADEVLVNHIPDWDDYTLEQEYFGEKNRAWKFYVEGEQAIPTGGSDLAEVSYLALILGFVGDIEDAFKEELRQEIPGGHQDETEARRYWATQLHVDSDMKLPVIFRASDWKETLSHWEAVRLGGQVSRHFSFPR